MSVNQEILNADQIEQIVRKLPTSQKRINARKRLRKATNKAIAQLVITEKAVIRSLKAHGANEGELRINYARISNLEQKYLYSHTGDKY